MHSIPRPVSPSTFHFVPPSLGTRLPGGPEPALTPRECEVLHLLAQGLPTRGIADRLCLSVKAVETYLQRVQKKVGCVGVRALTVFAVYWAWYGQAVRHG